MQYVLIHGFCYLVQKKSMIDLLEALGTYMYDRAIFHKKQEHVITLEEILSPLYNMDREERMTMEDRLN